MNASPIFVHSVPILLPSDGLVGGLSVVIDVLRATTVMVHAVDSGVRAIVPCLEVEDARLSAAAFPVEERLLGGERKGLPIEGFDLGNSPASYTPERCRDRTLVMTTTNGTRALLASLGAEVRLVAAFVNLSATVRAIEDRAGPRPVHLVCSGTDGQISLEDTLLAGAIASRLSSRAGRLANDEARMAARLWELLEIEGEAAEDRLYRALSDGRGGRRVREIGLDTDLRDACRIDRFDFALEVLDAPPRVVRLGV
ncbi:MAG: 2-phosphosulfolactate phosphatase [Isosphaeraceae bacterium]|nr:2-phosphosulfolactate phosphatase [Isosphaeraceae bacterium]